ncbi:MAG: prepilin-type N-terminal cleavage/methylation domain-containing protein [Patescibacteria group bacterium]
MKDSMRIYKQHANLRITPPSSSPFKSRGGRGGVLFAAFALHSSDSHRGKGFTIVEVLIVLAIVAVIAAFSVSSLVNFNAEEALIAETEKVLSLLTRARSQTLSAKEASVYGVHFEERKAVLFRGASFSAGAAGNQAQTLNDAVKIASIVLAGGGAEVVFQKLTGAAAQSGTITLASVRTPSDTKVITIAATGVAYSN